MSCSATGRRRSCGRRSVRCVEGLRVRGAGAASPLPQPRVDALATLVEQTGADAVLFGASVLSADVASGLAARLDAGLNWDLMDLSVADGELVGKRPALGDTVIVDVGWKGGTRLGLVRSGALDAVESGGAAEVESFETTFSDFSTLRRSSTRRRRCRADRRSRMPTSSSRAGAGSARRRASRCSRSWPPLWAAPSARRGQSSMPAGTRTRRRSARPASRSRRSCTSPAGSPGRSSTRSACRARERSSRSTRTRMRRSSTSATSASWAISMRSSRS